MKRSRYYYQSRVRRKVAVTADSIYQSIYNIALPERFSRVASKRRSVDGSPSKRYISSPIALSPSTLSYLAIMILRSAVFRDRATIRYQRGF